MDWLPIETAPKDGTDIDLWAEPFGRVPCAFWHEGCWSRWDMYGQESEPIDGTVTHWMPLPDPPNSKSRD